jgi:hypothetical protein
MSTEPTEDCQRLDGCPTGGVPANGECKSWRSCINRQNRTTHGLSGEPEYPAWKDLCRRARSRQYRTYGIGVDPEWERNPGPFIAYVRAYLPPFQLGDTLERTDNDLGYVVGNVKWATRAEQNQNRGHEDDARERGWHGSASCLCDQLMRQVCPCEAARSYRSGHAPDRDLDEDWPLAARAASPTPLILGEPTADGAIFLGSLFGEVRRDQYGVPWVMKRTLSYRPGIGPDGNPYLAPEPGERHEFSDLLDDEA